VGAALVMLCLSHVEEHLGQEPEVWRISGEEDWILKVAVGFFLEQLNGDGHQLVLFVKVEQGNRCHQLQNCKLKLANLSRKQQIYLGHNFLARDILHQLEVHHEEFFLAKSITEAHSLHERLQVALLHLQPE